MPDEVFILVIISIGAVSGLGWGLLRSVSQHFERKLRAQQGGDADQVLTELEELRARVGHIEDLQQRTLELEERVDFTERLLADGKDRNTASDRS